MPRDRARARGRTRARAEETAEEIRLARRKRGEERRRGRTGKQPAAASPNQRPESVVELAPYTGEVRESRLIEVQPITAALEQSDEILFGKLALASGLVTARQLQDCVQVQKALVEEDESDFLGDVLIREKILTRGEVEEILRVQHNNLQKRYKYTRHKRDEALFGRLIRENGYASESQINECLRQQAEIEGFDEQVPLGELMLAKGYIDEAAIEEVLNFQKKRAWTCPRCRQELTISLFEFGRRIRCPECREKFELPETPESNELKMTARTAKIKPPAAAPPKKKKKKKPEQQAPPAETAESTDAGGQPLAKGWFLALIGRAYGPISLRLVRKLLKLGLFGRDDLLWNRQIARWTAAGELEPLAAYLPRAAPHDGEGPPRPAQVASPKALAEALDQLLEQQRLDEGDHRKLRKFLANPFLR